MQALIRTAPPQAEQVSMSKTDVHANVRIIKSRRGYRDEGDCGDNKGNSSGMDNDTLGTVTTG